MFNRLQTFLLSVVAASPLGPAVAGLYGVKKATEVPQLAEKKTFAKRVEVVESKARWWVVVGFLIAVFLFVRRIAKRKKWL